jgi:GlcNAc-P-P-Und epimerase
MKILVTGGSGFLGTNLMEKLLRDNDVKVFNIDINPPRDKSHLPYWIEGDICDVEFISGALKDFKPHTIIHLAARCDLDGRCLSDYSANIEGVDNIIGYCNADKDVQRVLFLSSMLVCRLGYQPENDQDFCPSTIYGESKVIGEQLIREKIRPDLEWSILRPTSLWGPWFDVPYRSFFDAVRAGWFMMPANLKVYRSYGFVLNSVEQIVALVGTAKESMLYKVHYLADQEPIELSDWANKVIECSAGGKIYRPPWFILNIAAKLGDFLKLIGVSSPPLTSFRFKNMTTNAIYETDSWREIYSEQRYSMHEGVRITVDWLDSVTSGD